MRRRIPIVVAALALALLPAIGLAQQQTGTILGKVVDNSGAVLPGVTVTISGSPLLQPRILVTSETGTYRAPDLPIGTYSVKFELAGFRTLIRTEILLTIGFNAEVDAALEVSAIEETITVSGESPIDDTKSTTAAPGVIDTEMTQPFPREEMIKSIPLGNVGEPQDVADAVLFLVSQESKYITGQTISVNGGSFMG